MSGGGWRRLRCSPRVQSLWNENSCVDSRRGSVHLSCNRLSSLVLPPHSTVRLPIDFPSSSTRQDSRHPFLHFDPSRILLLALLLASHYTTPPRKSPLPLPLLPPLPHTTKQPWSPVHLPTVDEKTSTGTNCALRTASVLWFTLRESYRSRLNVLEYLFLGRRWDEERIK